MQRSDEEREKSHQKSDYDGLGASVEVTVRDAKMLKDQLLESFYLASFDIFTRLYDHLFSRFK